MHEISNIFRKVKFIANIGLLRLPFEDRLHQGVMSASARSIVVVGWACCECVVAPYTATMPIDRKTS